jgi:hypothetical protein
MTVNKQTVLLCGYLRFQFKLRLFEIYIRINYRVEIIHKTIFNMKIRKAKINFLLNLQVNLQISLELYIKAFL